MKLILTFLIKLLNTTEHVFENIISKFNIPQNIIPQNTKFTTYKMYIQEHLAIITC